MRTKLTVIILNYNTEELLKQCIESIAPAQDIVVIDNASSDGSVAMVKKHFPKVRLIVNKRNLGFAKANNIGLRSIKGEYVLLLNPDTVVDKDTVKTVVGYMENNKQTGVATCRVELPDGTLDEACHRGFPTPWNAFAYFSGLAKLFPKSRLFGGYLMSYLPFDETHEIDSGTGAFMMIRVMAGKQVGWLDEDYFWYGEDLDFCYRVKKAGWKVVYIPGVKIKHYKGASSGIKRHSRKISTASRETKIRSAKASTQAMRVFFTKHYQDRYPKLLIKAVDLGIDMIENIRVVKMRLFN